MLTKIFILNVGFMLVGVCWCTSSLSGIQYNRENGEYTNLLFAIDETIQEDPELIEKLKENLIASSDVLSVATKRQTRLGEIKILIPKSWNMEAEATFLESYANADARIRDTKLQAPFVSGVPECGREGRYMQLSVDFVKGDDRSFGAFHKTFVHEWGHLRWGLKDEYASDGVPQFYISAFDESLQWTRCGLDLKYDIHTLNLISGTSSRGCRIDPATQMYGNACYGRYNLGTQTATASLMNYQHLEAIVDFCDNDPSQPGKLHNKEAPSNQNSICAYRSAWEVMRDHSDFAQPVASLSTEPTRFRILKQSQQQQTLRVVIVMDVSGSMNGDRIAELHLSVTQLINEILPHERTRLGLVQFSTTATKLTSELNALTEATKANLAGLVPTTASGSTGIGLGLQAALALLNADGPGAAASSHIIVLSDGAENIQPNVVDVIPSLVQAGVTAHSIIFQAGDNVLRTLAQETGGSDLFADGLSGSVGLSEAFTQIVSAIDIDAGFKTKQKIVSSRLVTNDTGVCTSVSIDSGLSKDVLFSFQWLGTVAVNIRVTQPNGTEWTPTTQSYSLSTSASLQLDTIPEVGAWNLCLSSIPSEDVKVAVFASAPDIQVNTTDEETLLPPITLETIIDNEEPDFLLENEKVKLFAIVRRGDTDAVIGATVEATISSDSKSETFIMTDSGSGADVVRNDGIYSLYLIKAENTGKHSVQVRVVGTKENTRIKERLMDYTFREGTIRKDPESPQDDFERVALAGFFDVQAVSNPNIDTIAPARIQDLRLVNVSEEEKYVTIQWTAVGDDFDQGTAFEHILWVANNVSEVLDGNRDRVPQTQLRSGNLSSPNDAYTSQTIEIWMLNRTIATFAVQAVDEQGQEGPISNAITVTIINLAPPTTTLPPTTTTLPATTTKLSLPTTMLSLTTATAPPAIIPLLPTQIIFLIVSICVSIFVAVLAVIIIGIHKIRNRRSAMVDVAFLMESSEQKNRGNSGSHEIANYQV